MLLPDALSHKNNPDPAQLKPLLTVQNLSSCRDERVLFEPLSFSLAAGEVLQIEGPNGSGKTSLLRIIAGLSKHYEGQFCWRGEPINRNWLAFTRETQWVGHLGGVKAALTPLENLRWSDGLYQAQTDAQILVTLEQLGLAGFEHCASFTLSAGQNRRVALARLVLSSALLWILDEPFTALDSSAIGLLEQLIFDHAQQGGAVLLSTHHNLQLPGRLKTIQLEASDEHFMVGDV